MCASEEGKKKKTICALKNMVYILSLPIEGLNNLVEFSVLKKLNCDKTSVRKLIFQ